MGIEPTDHMISTRPDGFEDRGLHQQSKHFQEQRFYPPLGQLMWQSEREASGQV